MPSDIQPPNSNALAIANGETDPITAMLMRAATDPNFDPQKFEVAVKFLVDREDKANLRAFNRAMGRAQNAMHAVSKDGKHPRLNLKYSTLDAMLKVILPAITPEGLHLRFGTQVASIPGNECVTCIVSHDDGHQEIVALEGPIMETTGVRGGQMQMNDIQAVGSTTTYLKRYALGMAFTLILADEQDDDGEGRTRGGNGGKTPPSTPPRDVPPNIARGVARFPSLAAQLQKVPDTDALGRFTGNERFQAFHKAQTLADGRLIDDMIAARRIDLGEAARAASEARVREARAAAEAARAAAAPADYVPDETEQTEPVETAQGMPEEATVLLARISARAAETAQDMVPSEQANVLLARIAACATETALQSCMTAPEFTAELAKLSWVDGDLVTQAFKARAAELAGGGAA